MSPAVEALRSNLGDAIGKALKTSGMSHQAAGEACGKHQTNISAAIRAKGCSIEKQIDILEALGFKVEIVVKGVDGEKH